MSSLKSRLFDKWGKPIMASPDLRKKAFGLFPSIYEAPNAGRFRPRYYTEQDAEIGINQYNRSLLLRFSREMTSQQPWIAAGVRLLSLFSVGDQYKPNYCGVNSGWGKEATAWLLEWYKNPCSRGPNMDFQALITNLSETVDVDGDILLLFGEDKSGPKIQLVPSHRIRSLGSNPFSPAVDVKPIQGPTANTVVSDGVVYNMEGAPIGYSIQNRENMVNSTFSNSNGNITFVSSKNARLVYQVRFPDRGRGLPTISSGILQALSVQECESYLIEKLKIQSMYATVEAVPEGEGPLEEEEAYRRAANTMNELNGLSPIAQPWMNASKGLRVVNSPAIKYVAASPGVEIKFPAASITDKETADQITRLETHVLSCLGVPHALLFSPDDVAGKMNNSIIDVFNASIKKRQQLLDFHGKFILGWAVSKAIKNKELPPNDEEILTNCFEFTHPHKFTLDDNKNRKSDLDEYMAGTRSLNEIAKRRNTTSTKILEDIQAETTEFLKGAQKIAKDTGMDINIVLEALRENLKQKQASPSGDSPGKEEK